MQAKNCTHILFMKSFVFKTSFSISYSIPYYHNVSSTAIFSWLPVSINWLPQIKMVSQFWEIASIWSTLYIWNIREKLHHNFAILSYIYLIAFLKNVVLGFNIRIYVRTRTDVAVLPCPSSLTVTLVSSLKILAGVGIHTGTTAALVRVQLTVSPAPAWGTQAPIAVDAVHACAPMETRIWCTLIDVCMTKKMNEVMMELHVYYKCHVNTLNRAITK